MPLEPLRRLIDGEAASPLPLHRMAGPIDTGARSDRRTDLDTLPVEGTDRGVDHSRLHIVRTGVDKRLFLLAEMGAGPAPFAQAVLPLTPGAVQLADARGFTGLAFDARGNGRYALMLEIHGIGENASFKADFSVGESLSEVRIPFATFRGPDPLATLDLARLKALIVRLAGEPGGKRWLELGNVRFY